MVSPPKAGPSRIPAVGELKRGERGTLPYLLRQASATVRLAIDRALTDLDVTGPQFLALVLIGAYPDLSSADLARLSWLTPQTVNVIVRNLETRGAIKRHPHPVHGRILVLEMTPEGRRLLAQCRARADAIGAQLAAGFGTKKEGEIVRRWLVYAATTLRLE